MSAEFHHMRVHWLCLTTALFLELAITLMCEWLLARGHAQAAQLRWLLHFEGLIIPLLLLGFLAKASKPQRATLLATLATVVLLLAIPVNRAIPEPHIQIDKSRNELVVQDASKAKLLTIFVGLDQTPAANRCATTGGLPREAIESAPRKHQTENNGSASTIPTATMPCVAA
jgi:hypothetical protein